MCYGRAAIAPGFLAHAWANYGQRVTYDQLRCLIQLDELVQITLMKPDYLVHLVYFNLHQQPILLVPIWPAVKFL